MFTFVYVLRRQIRNAKITDRVLLRCAHITHLTLDWLGRLPPRPVALTGSNMLHTNHPKACDPIKGISDIKKQP